MSQQTIIDDKRQMTWTTVLSTTNHEQHITILGAEEQRTPWSDLCPRDTQNAIYKEEAVMIELVRKRMRGIKYPEEPDVKDQAAAVAWKGSKARAVELEMDQAEEGAEDVYPSIERLEGAEYDGEEGRACGRDREADTCGTS